MAITLNINDRAIEVPDGSSVLDAINTSGTYIPQLCKDPDMKAIGHAGHASWRSTGCVGTRHRAECPRLMECVSPRRARRYATSVETSFNSPSR